MKIQDLRKKTDAELRVELLKFRKESLNMRFQQTNGVLENPARISVLRKGIARIKTLLTERKENIR